MNRPRQTVEGHYGDFTVLLARQRSGTNALRSVLGTHPDIHCFNEVLHYAIRQSDSPGLRKQSYFNWLAEHAGGDIERLMPDQQDGIFAAYLEHLRTLTRSRVRVVDVKYNMVHLIVRPHQPLGTYALFDLAREHGMRVLNLVRLNYLRCYLSHRKARVTGVHGVRGGPAKGEPTLRVDPADVLRKLKQYEREDALVERAFAGYRRYLRCEYAKVFTPEGTAENLFLEQIAEWFGVEPKFDVKPQTAKLTALPLWEAIENWREVESALRPTRFAHCLDDEPSYVARAGHRSSAATEDGEEPTDLAEASAGV